MHHLGSRELLDTSKTFSQALSKTSSSVVSVFGLLGIRVRIMVCLHLPPVLRILIHLQMQIGSVSLIIRIPSNL